MSLDAVGHVPGVSGSAFARQAPACQRLRIALVGASGKVGSNVLALIEAQAADLRAHGIELCVTTLINSRTFVQLESATTSCAALQRLRDGYASTTPLAAIALTGTKRADIVIDCSASSEVAAHYPRWLAAGIAIVTPNKHAASADRLLVHAIAAASASSGAELFDSTTVGAQLPLTPVLRDLHRAGDKIVRIDAVLSGTLSFVLARMHEGVALSTAVAEAITDGYAEPHPGCDLSGEDVARKLLILLRACGHDLELRDIQRVPLVEASLLEPKHIPDLLRNLATADVTWRSREALASARGERWIYRATFDNGIARVAPERVASTHPFARLAPVENALILHSALYDRVPLSICGPGAGVALTAVGVFADLLCAAKSVAERALLPRAKIDVVALPTRSAA